MKSFTQYLEEAEKMKRLEERVSTLSLALEHHTYKDIPGTKNSFRVDSQNTNTMTQRHAHVYAKRNGGGKELYSVNLDGTGHDGSSGMVIPQKHADHFLSLGFSIPNNLILESIDFESLSPDLFEICVFSDDV
ncbi:hypothetical protein [Rheinheimera sp.]|uniref:hypothetical protein n=1 Tax=Rheinheimera sp. TaxID=1869214 RepID=UPI002353321E|nr:hypothetical protein [Rheinheimera sp.]